VNWLPDAACRLVAIAELRRRWRSSALLGVLIGVVAGLAMAGVGGARRAATAFDRYEAVSPMWDVGVVPNDPTFDTADRQAIARLPMVEQASAFAVAPLMAAIDGVEQPDLFAYLPTVPEDYGEHSAPADQWAILRGRVHDPAVPDEAIISEDVARAQGLDVGSSFELVSQPEAFARSDEVPAPRRYPMRVVGVFHPGNEAAIIDPSPAFMAAHGGDFEHLVNLAVWLRPGADVESFQAAAAEATGRPTLAVIDLAKAKGDTRRTTLLEANGLALFALAVLVGGGTLVGQALVRTVTAAAADAATLGAVGFPRRRRLVAVVLPAVPCALIAAVVAGAAAVSLSPLFPIGESRRFELDRGVTVDAFVLPVGLVATVAGVLSLAWVAAWWATIPHAPTLRRHRLAGAVLRAPAPVPLTVGARLALDPGRGQRAVPVRSAAIGAVVGVLGVVGSFTFRAGIEDTLAHPERAGVQSDAFAVNVDYMAELAESTSTAVRDEPAVAAASRATWWRALPIGPNGTAVWSYEDLVGSIPVTVLRGRQPRAPDEIALAPRTMAALRAGIGDRLPAGEEGEVELLVVGEVLLPDDSHQGYDAGAFMTPAGANALAPPGRGAPVVDRDEGFLLRWRPGAEVATATDRLSALGLEVREPGQPANLTSLETLLTLPFWLGCFLGLLAVATVAHALTTTVRRRRQELAILAALGLSSRQARLSIAVQATLLAMGGLLLGVPLGVAVGRTLWRTLIDRMSFLYVAPLAMAALLLVWPTAVAVANVLAAAPARAAGRIRPAVVLRSE
jgi:hypothetical protein